MFFLLFSLKRGKSYSILGNMSGKLLYTEAFCSKKVKCLPKVGVLSILSLKLAKALNILSLELAKAPNCPNANSSQIMAEWQPTGKNGSANRTPL